MEKITRNPQIKDYQIRRFFVQPRRVTLNAIVRGLRASTLVLIFLATFYPAAAFAEEQKKVQDQQPAEEPIQITADRLESNAEQKYAEFIGNVKASQGNFKINSDTLRIYYSGDLINRDKQATNENLLNKIVAKGNVEILSDQYEAKTDEAQYDVKTMTIVLAGENSTVTSGQNSISGSKIILYRADGRVKVEGGKNRVNAVFFSKGKVTDMFGEGKSEKKSKNVKE
jgi:lipopolysaccharide export system protein LptA